MSNRATQVESRTKLRDYQNEVLHKALAAIKAGQNPLIVMPTASGKTHVLVELLKHFNKTLTLAHRRELVIKPCGLLSEEGIGHGYILSGEVPDWGNLIRLTIGG